MLRKYCLDYFEMDPVASIITGITFASTFHIRWNSIYKFFIF